MKQFIDTNVLTETINKIYTEVINDHKKDYERIDDFWDEEQIMEYVEIAVKSINENMRKYLYGEVPEMSNNFLSNIWLWFEERSGENSTTFLEELKLRDATEKELKILTDWFFNAIGTWGLKYNFSTMIGEWIYCEEMEESEE